MVNFNNFKQGVLRNANELGLSNSNPISIVVLGPAPEGYTINKRVTTSYVSPSYQVYGIDPEELWLNANDSHLYRASPLGVWNRINSYAEIFEESSGGDGSGGGGDMSGLFDGSNATAPIYLSRDPQSPNEAVTKKYVDDYIATLVANLPVATPVQTIDDLRALDTSKIQDKRLVFVEDITKIYAYDAQSVESEGDDGTIILPNSGVGRWKATVQSSLDAGSF